MYLLRVCHPGGHGLLLIPARRRCHPWQRRLQRAVDRDPITLSHPGLITEPLLHLKSNLAICLMADGADEGPGGGGG